MRGPLTSLAAPRSPLNGGLCTNPTTQDSYGSHRFLRLLTVPDASSGAVGLMI